MPDISPIINAITTGQYHNSDIQRLFHGRGHTFDGLDFITVDWYPPALFVCLFRPVEPSWLDELTEQLWQLSQKICPDLATALVVQNRQGAKTESQVVRGELEQPHVVSEQGMKFNVQLLQSQNTGIFADMVNGRRWVKANSDNKNVLNLFAYTCAFSLAALQGGARAVVNIDMNKSVMATGRKNHQLNDDIDISKAKFFTHNIFNSWGKIKRYGEYDLIIIDPPSFQKGSFALTKDYQKLIKRLPDLAADNADVLLCLNAPDVPSQFIFDLVSEFCPALEFIERIENHQDFPEVNIEKSLKVLRFRF
ncbi:MAG: 23S rRNA (cytosine1962-C5)-methyltransferase [Phenylobacterium sp.]|jgi:23S rRNA (cytosine1962-C5)-methyltransferase